MTEVTPGNVTGSGIGIQGAFQPVGAGDYVPLGKQPVLPDVSNTFASHLSNPTPPNQTLVYSPDTRIIIAHGVLQYDISADIIRGTLIRKENSASTLIWECHNKGLRYTSPASNVSAPAFSRMDRVVCYMKRTGNWIQMFSGYLDSVPFLQLYPGIVSFKATCTLKRLLCYWWNPSLVPSAQLFNQYTSPSQEVGGSQDNQSPGTNGSRDSNLGSILGDLLTKVGHWLPENVHIQNFPTGFLDLLQNQLKEQQANTTQALNFQKYLQGDNNPAPLGAANYNTGAGAPGPTTFNIGNTTGGGGIGAASPPGAGQAFYVQEIVAACDALGMGPNTTNLNVASGLQQSDTTGEGARDQATKAAFQQAQTIAKNYQTSLTNQDAAILGVATAIVESGIRVLANAGVPESLNIQNDGLGHDGTSVGLFQQTEGNGWGTVAQRMNPRQSATMFFQRLQGTTWQNVDPGVACWNVQHAADQTKYEGLIDAAVPQATKLVQTYRQSTSSPGSSTVATATGSAPVQLATSLAPTLGISGLGAVNQPTASPNAVLTGFGSGSGVNGGALPSGIGSLGGSRPNPDSEGAIAYMGAQLGKPYVWGGTGPNGFDCSGLMYMGFKAIGLDIGRNTTAQAGKGQRIAPSNIQRGDTLQCEGGGHTMMWMGDGTIIEAATEGVPIHRRPAYVQPASASGIFRFCQNGGALPGAPYNDPLVSGPGQSPSVVLASQGSVNGGTPGGSSNEPIARNLFAYLFQPNLMGSDVALMYSAATPQKDFINAQPLIQAVQSICGSSLRNFASAPNGDFIAYYPDFFGMDGKPAVFLLEDVELKDLTLNFSDDSLATHVYVNGSLTLAGEYNATMGWLLTMGYATVENDMLYQRVRAVSPGSGATENLTGLQLMSRFGVRPIQVDFPMAGTADLEFLLSVKIFLEKWAAQYQSSVGMTFMPDLFPGMRVLFANHNLQVYVQEVTHTFDFEHGFTTQAVVTAPSNPNAAKIWGALNSGTPIPATTGPVPSVVTI